ncbi:MAG: hypothetical protein ABJA67_01800 [Chthonomonadales bacterium]
MENYVAAGGINYGSGGLYYEGPAPGNANTVTLPLWPHADQSPAGGWDGGSATVTLNADGKLTGSANYTRRLLGAPGQPSITETITFSNLVHN